MPAMRPLWFYAADGTRVIITASSEHNGTRAWESTCEDHGEIAVAASPASDLAVAVTISHIAHEHGGPRHRGAARRTSRRRPGVARSPRQGRERS